MGSKSESGTTSIKENFVQTRYRFTFRDLQIWQISSKTLLIRISLSYYFLYVDICEESCIY